MADPDVYLRVRAAAWTTSLPWLVLIGMAVSCLWLVDAHGFTMPRGDEWAWLPLVTGKQPITLSWLWSQHYDHRLFLPRLIYLGLGRLTGYSFQAGAYFNVALLAALAAMMIRAARRMRGATHWSDAFFPLVLLHWGHFYNFGWGFQLSFVTAVFFIGIVVIIMARCTATLATPPALLATVCSLAAGLCGSYGLAYLPPIALWLALAALGAWHDKPPRVGHGLVLVALSASLVAFTLVYLRGLSHPQPPNTVDAASVLDRVRTGLEFLSGNLGLAGNQVGLAASLLTFFVAAVSVRRLARSRGVRGEFLSAAGLLGIFAGVAAMACGIGAGRAWIGAGAGYSSHYHLLLTPALCGFYLQSLRPPAGDAGRRLTVALCLLMCLLAPINTWKGLRSASVLTARQRAVAIDARHGLSPEALAARYCDWSIFEPTEAISRERYETLWSARLGPFRGFAPDAQASGVIVRRLHQITAGATPQGTLQIKAGQPLCEQFTLTGPTNLDRIDVELGWARRAPRRVAWELAEIGPAGDAQKIADGQTRLDRAVVQGTLSLPIPRLRIEGRRTFRLKIEVPRDVDPTACLPVPLFALDAAFSPATSSLAPTFLFFGPEGSDERK